MTGRWTVALALAVVPGGLAAQVPDGPWPWERDAAWHAVVDWPPAGTPTTPAVLRAARGALVVGRPARAQAILDAQPLPEPALLPAVLALRAAVAAARGVPDTAALLYEEAARAEQGVARGLLAARAGDAWEAAGRGRAAAAQYLTASIELPAIGGWLRVRAARAQGTDRGMGLLIGVPPPAAGLATLVRGDLLLAAGDTVRAFGALAAAGARARAAALAAAHGDSAIGRRFAYAALAGEDTVQVREALSLIDVAFPPRSSAEFLLAGRAATRVRERDRAAEYGRRAAAQPDASPEAFVQWGEWLELAGRRTEALAAYAGGGTEGAYLRARLLVRSRRTEAARTALLQFVQDHPDHPRAPAALYLAADIASADSLFRVLAERWPADGFASRARARLASRALARGARAAAAAWYEQEVEHRGADRNLARFLLARLQLARGDTAAGRTALTALAGDDSVGYYGTMAREDAGLPPPVFAPPPPREPTPAVVSALRELDLLDAAGFGTEADVLVAFLLDAITDPDEQLDLAGGLTARGRAPEGITLGWRAAAALGLNHPRVIRAVFPWPSRSLIEAEAAKFGLDPYLLAGLIRQESSFREAARSRAGALGLMQLMPSTGRWLARRLDVPWNDEMFIVADANLHLGSAHLAALLRTFDGRVVPAIAAYNAGGTPVRRWLRARGATDVADFVERIPYVETRGYVKTVLRNRALYRALYGPPAPAAPASGSALDSPRNGGSE